MRVIGIKWTVIIEDVLLFLGLLENLFVWGINAMVTEIVVVNFVVIRFLFKTRMNVSIVVLGR